MKPIELEICQPSGTTSTAIIEVASNATWKQILRVAQQLLRTCGWKRVRVGIGSNWSQWIY